jgi:hypothetical protein
VGTIWNIASGLLANDPGLSFSADGRYLAYAMLPSATSPKEVHRFDLQKGTDLLVSQGPLRPGGDASDNPSISGDGRFVAYRS